MKKGNGIASRIIAGMMVSALMLTFAGPAFAYTFTGQKMGDQLWYRPQAVFYDESKESFRLAMSTWNQILPEWRRLCFDRTNHYLTSYPSKDGNNSIYKMYAGNTNYLAQNTWWYNTSTNIISESDVNINASYDWTNGAAEGRYDVRSVMLHEMGHSVGLSHSEYTNAVMYYATYANTTKWNLTSDDINGANARY